MNAPVKCNEHNPLLVPPGEKKFVCNMPSKGGWYFIHEKHKHGVNLQNYGIG